MAEWEFTSSRSIWMCFSYSKSFDLSMATRIEYEIFAQYFCLADFDDAKSVYVCVCVRVRVLKID